MTKPFQPRLLLRGQKCTPDHRSEYGHRQTRPLCLDCPHRIARNVGRPAICRDEFRRNHSSFAPGTRLSDSSQEPTPPSPAKGMSR